MGPHLRDRDRPHHRDAPQPHPQLHPQSHPAAAALGAVAAAALLACVALVARLLCAARRSPPATMERRQQQQQQHHRHHRRRRCPRERDEFRFGVPDDDGDDDDDGCCEGDGDAERDGERGEGGAAPRAEEIATMLDEVPVVEVRVQPQQQQPRRFGASNVALRICTKPDGEGSPPPPASGKENAPSPRAFSYSPKYYSAAECKSPKFFAQAECKSPKFFAASECKSPKFSGSPRSPRTYLESRGSRTASPKISNNGNESRFDFDRGMLESVENNNAPDDKNDLSEDYYTPNPDVDFVGPDSASTDSTDRTELDANVNVTASSPSKIVPDDSDVDHRDNLTVNEGTASYRRQRLKSISLDSDNAKFIEQNLGLPIAKHLKQENLYDSDDGRRGSPPVLKSGRSFFDFDVTGDGDSSTGRPSAEPEPPATDDVDSSASNAAFGEVHPRFSPKEFVITDYDARTPTKGTKNKRNLTIDLSKRDEELEKELSDYECFDSEIEKRLTPKTPTLKVKATSLDSSETLNLSLPQNNTLQVPQNSISVPNTPKRQYKRTLSQKCGKLVKASHYVSGNYGGNLSEAIPRICSENQARKIYMNLKCPSSLIDSGIFLKENHANLMLFQAAKCAPSRGINANSGNFSRRMGSFDENMTDVSHNRQTVAQAFDNRVSLPQKSDSNMLGSNLMNFKQNLSVSSTNLKTLPEGVPSNDFEVKPEEKTSKKTLLQRRGSNQSLTINLESSGSNLKYSTLSLQGSNLSLASFGASSHNLANIKNSVSNFSLNTDNRQKKNILERRNSNTSLTLNLDYQQGSRLYSSSHCNLQSSQYSLSNQENQSSGATKKCLLQRRGSNTSLTLNLQGSGSNLNRCISNSSLNIHNETKTNQKKGLLERRTSNTSLSLNINSGNPQFDNNRVLSVSNYNLDGGNNLSRYSSNQSINNAGEHKKGLLERRSSNTSLTLNINSSSYNLQGSEVPRDIEIDDSVLQNNLKSFADGELHGNQKDKQRKSLSTENLFSKSYKSRTTQCRNADSFYSFGSHDNLWSNCATDSVENIEVGQNLTYICGDQENEIIYAFGDRAHLENAGFQTTSTIRNITTKPLSPHSTSEDFKLYLANIQHLQNASNVLTRQQLKNLNSVFKESYSKSECPLLAKRNSATASLINQMNALDVNAASNPDDNTEGEYNPQRLLPEPVLPCTEYQKSLLRNLHQEFWDLPTNFQEKPMVFGSHPKNRYKTILPNEHSRVILRAEPGEIDEGYINANYIKGHEFTRNTYIATQGPLQNTIYDFWLMVYQNGCQFHQDGCTKTNEDRHFGSPQTKSKIPECASKKFVDSKKNSVQKIVMLTNLLENGRQKCEKYFPCDLNEEMVFKRVTNSSYSSCGEGVFFPDADGNASALTEECADINTFKIKNIGILHKTGYTIRKLFVEYRNKYLSDSAVTTRAETDNLIVYHYWFDNWADHKCPQDVTALLDLSLDVAQSRSIDFGELPTERRLSAFQTAKAFFDEFAKANSQEDHSKLRPGRKNSLASKLDLPKPRRDVVARRESTGAIDSSKVAAGAKAAFLDGKSSAAESPTKVDTPPLIVHCSAGIGRTGCLIAVLNGIKQLKADERVDILGIVCNMRLNRGGMVQNSEQYELIHKVLCLYEDIDMPDVD